MFISFLEICNHVVIDVCYHVDLTRTVVGCDFYYKYLMLDKCHHFNTVKLTLNLVNVLRTVLVMFYGLN